MKMKKDKWALLIGINQYQKTATPMLQDLKGPLADIADIRMLLQKTFAFDPAKILTLTDQQATRERIITALRTHLAANAKVNDTVVVYFSGHGSYRLKDGIREGTLIAHDSRGEGGMDIGGGLLSGLFREIAAKNMAIVLDCCHSGNLIESRGHKPAATARTAPPDLRDIEHELPQPDTLSRGVSMRPDSAPFALLSAAGPLELALETELEGKHRGIFTYYFTKTLERMGSEITYRDVIDRMRVLVGGWYGGQTPQLEGVMRDQLVFGDRELTPQPYILVESVVNDQVRLAAGQLAGVTTSSHYAVYRPGEKNLSGKKPEAKIEIIEASAVTSQARIISGKKVLPASRAVEIKHHDACRVLVKVVGIEGLAERLSSYQHLEMISNHDSVRTTDLTITGKNKFLEVQLPGIGMDTLPGPPIQLKLENAERLVLHWAKWLRILHLQNTDADLKLDFEIESVETGAADVPTDLPGPVFYDDCCIRYKIANNSGRNLYIGLVALSDDGSISKVFPTTSGSKLLMGNGRCEGLLNVDQLKDRFCEFNVLKLFAAAEPCDYELLEVEGIHLWRRGSAYNEFEELLAEAAFGQSRKIRSSNAPVEWGSIQRNVVIYSR
jgi:hypothetical protein